MTAESSDMTTVTVGDVLADHYIITSRITTGINSDVFSAKNYEDERDFIVKHSRKCSKALEKEANIYKLLEGAPKGIPKLLLYSRLAVSPEVSFIVMERFGNSIKDYWDMCDNRFNYITASNIAIQVLERLEFVHHSGVLHGDISPENLVMGRSKHDETTVHLIDFGSSKRFSDARSCLVEGDSSKYILVSSSESPSDIESEDFETEVSTELLASVLYVSSEDEVGHAQMDDTEDTEAVGTPLDGVSAQHSGQISCCDDLTSLGLMLAHLTCSLPSEGNTSTSALRDIKKYTSSEGLCKEFPQAFDLYFKYLHSLKPREKPDYNVLVLLFKDYLHEETRKRGTKSVMFEWMAHPEYVQPSK